MRFVAAVRRWGLLALGLVGMVVGLILLLRPIPSSFGWTAYASPSATTFLPYVPASYVVGAIILAISVALAAGWVGFALGRRGKRLQQTEPRTQAP